MKRLFFVEPVVAIYAFAYFMASPLLQQFVYRRLWEELTNSSYPGSENSSDCTPNKSNVTSGQEVVQKAASIFFLYTDLFSLIPSLLVTLILVARSDRRGRKMTILLPLIGATVSSLAYFFVSFFTLNLYLLLVASFVSSLFGGFGTLLGGCFSYVADLCDNAKQKNIRMALVDMVIGLLSGIASLSTGYFLREMGFNWPFLTTAVLHCLNIIYVIFFLEETVKTPAISHLQGPDPSPLKQLFFGVYLLFAASSAKRNTIFIILLLAFSFYNFANIGGLSIFILYELNTPLCWSEILIGYGSALSTLIFLTSFAGVSLLSFCLDDIYIVLIGLLSVMSGMLMTAFAKTTLLMFLVRLPLLFAVMPAPVLRSMMSKIVLDSEQGALFACIAFVENLSGTVSFAVFNSIYAATVSSFSGFSFLLAAGLSLIPLGLMGIMFFLRPQVTQETQGLVTEDGLDEGNE
ncbi:lysosomal proton-coupled steroid conjugate and bile acid symporter SLC46A3 isoform X1 [Acipenser ruthenus]|uniref:lysosomal proton-coupled steroid conjugate and bile acid symporter SLC46A3 isoform X1 n=1 Tax=Acipenser ruthenus TaxID=7906 RepID=UPI002742513B|nr:lysosomal proton-coupled steroid conjugate and bile acid symporter SLC46A3 isoform X1 [Acipenser ruthenus]XP_033864490.3 lysosomal proton-coupled steroid conjugate and bile acid symporter SLC46A3 isoform X1 [Acipenser ruthenus]XP_033864491.3 lysosomal proton-coupled steroid conjugate and bile acid symporter SLC46A3 isoform X1 [Acipenser ruthenus]